MKSFIYFFKHSAYSHQFFVPRFATLNCLASSKKKIQGENRDNRLPQEKTDYRWQSKNDGEMHCLKKFIFASFIILSMFLVHPTSANAAGYGLSLNPPLLRVNIKPGKSITQVFTINNLTSDDKFLVARLVPFTEADKRGNPVIDLRESASWLNYFSLANTSIKLGTPFTIKGGSSEQLILSMSVPEDAILRDLYATLLVSTYANVGSLEYQGSQVSATIGSNLLITIHSEIAPSTLLKIEDLVPVKGAFIKLGNFYLADNITPMSFSATVVNDGDFTAETKGLFRITTRTDNPVFLDGVLPVNVLAGSSRILINTDGEEFVFNPGLDNIGVYKPSIQIRTDNANADISINIFFFPFKIFFGLIIAGAILLQILKFNKNSKIPID